MLPLAKNTEFQRFAVRPANASVWHCTLVMAGLHQLEVGRPIFATELVGQQ
jgi:hypothetical protein